ncbi:hypothetical protein GX51_03756 [Blastomyces parvus]|uniref:Uncharacterized protein n=1 Tax=Blastomyces parvus TaxID=2060905 RepID=A0A2B7X4Y4_9EURO|nr:hypothetical protein GX51_03756 [Blastomyces parvus]
MLCVTKVPGFRKNAKEADEEEEIVVDSADEDEMPTPSKGKSWEPYADKCVHISAAGRIGRVDAADLSMDCRFRSTQQ